MDGVFDKWRDEMWWKSQEWFIWHPLLSNRIIAGQMGRLSRISKPRPKPKVSVNAEPKPDSDSGNDIPVDDRSLDEEGKSKASESSKEEEVLLGGYEEEQHDELWSIARVAPRANQARSFFAFIASIFWLCAAVAYVNRATTCARNGANIAQNWKIPPSGWAIYHSSSFRYNDCCVFVCHEHWGLNFLGWWVWMRLQWGKVERRHDLAERQFRSQIYPLRYGVAKAGQILWILLRGLP